MAYRLNLDMPIPDAVRACAHEQLADAVRLLREEHAADPVAAVHGARKDLKKTRSLLRLVRPALKEKAYRRLNAELRDTARDLSGTRDADVMLETLDDLAGRFAGQVPRKTFTALKRSFGARARAARKAGDDGGHPDVVARLEAAQAEVAAWPLERVDRKTLVAGAVRAYARGQRERARAEAEPTAESLHEWRKRVKDLWYHLRLLEEAWPPVLRALGEEAHRLSDLLGDEHDLAVLAERLEERRGAAVGAPVDEDEVVALTLRRREELRGEAFALGARLYAERPKAYGRRLTALLAAPRRDGGG